MRENYKVILRQAQDDKEENQAQDDKEENQAQDDTLRQVQDYT